MEETLFREILERYLAGKASADEEAWLESAYINLYNHSPSIQTEDELETQSQQIWNQVSEYTMPSRKRNTILPFVYAAAALLIISLISIFIYKQNHPSSELANLPASKDIKAGKDRATLVLANGQRINLDGSNNGYLTNQLGVRISKTASGQVVYELTDQPVATNQVAYNTIETPAGGQYQINLPDGSKVWLNASSSLTFATSFKQDRNVKLKGEAYFEVSKILADGKRVPFVVESAKQRIEVLGTHFNVNAYPDENNTKTTLLEGSVKVNDLAILKPNQQAKGNGEDIKIFNVNAEDFVDWKNGDFILENNDFRSIMRKIARWYDVEVIYSDDAPQKLNLGGWISRSKNISSILEIMEQTGKVHFNIEGRRITVTR